MYDLNREVAEKLKTSSVFSTTSPIAEATTVNMRAVEKLCAKQIHPLTGQRHFRTVTGGPAGMRGDVFHDE
jgi:hypothetical protein